MRIDYVVPYFFPAIGGTETTTLTLARFMSQTGQSVTVHTSSRGHDGRSLPESEWIEGIHIRRYRLHLGPQIFPRIGDESDVVHVHSFGLNPNLFEALRRGSSVRVFTPHAMFMAPSYTLVPKTVVRGILHRYGKLVAQTHQEARFLVECVGVKQRRVETIYASVPSTSFEKGSDLEELTMTKRFVAGSYILGLGRVVEAKHLWVGISALAKLPARVEYLIVGPIIDRSVYLQCLRLARRLGVESRLHFLGQLSEVEKRAVIRGAIAGLSSGFEAFSLASVEIMAQGRPVVAADHLGLAEVIRPGVNGLHYTFDDPWDAATKLNLLIDDSRLAESLGASAREWAQQNCSSATMGSKTLEMYRETSPARIQ
jgi:glycosyltransferase involved in cell wall biosynthesis